MTELKVLIVDDDHSMAKFVLNALKYLFGWQCVDVANSPDEVYNFFERNYYRLVISDFDLKSSINGADVILYARDRCPEIWTILMSGNLGEKIPGTSIDKAMPKINYIWQKPIPVTLVKKTIQELLERGKGG